MEIGFAAMLGLFAFAAHARAQTVQTADVTFEVHVPPRTPAEDDIYISGNIPELGPWDPGRRRLERAGRRRFAVTLEIPVGTRLEYKITRGSWETVEKGSRGEEIANRQLAVTGDDTVEVRVAKWRDQVEERPRRPSTLTGNIRHLGRIRSEVLGNARDVWVYLPASYETAADRRYPVVYFHDGQNVFDAATAYVGIEWQADETLERLGTLGRIRETIAVAVANTSERVREYTHTPEPKRSQGGDAKLYLRFLTEELKPRIDAEFRTLPDREDTGLIGASLGGLVSLYAGLVAWETFGLVAGVSPSLWWADRDLEKLYAEAPLEQLPLRLWIDMGTAEISPVKRRDGAPDMIADLRSFRDVLVQRGYERVGTLGYFEHEGAIHNESAWARRLPQILRFLLPPVEKR